MLHKVKKLSPTQWNEWMFIFAITCAFFFLHGYQSHEGDHAEHLPQIYRLHNPDLFQGDYFLEGYDQQFNIRTVYVYTVYTLSHLIPIRPLLFILCFLCVMLSVRAFFFITRHFFPHGPAPYLALPLIYLFLFNFTLGGNVITYPIFICSTAGKAFTAWGLLYFLRNKLATSGILIGLGTLYQMLAGFQLFALLLGTMVLLDQFRPQRSWFRFTASYLIAGAFMLGPVFYGMFFGQAEYDKELYYDILFEFKNKAHYNPSEFPWFQYAKFIPLFIAAWVLSRSHDAKRFFQRFFLLGALGLIIYTVLFELIGWRTIGLTQWFKSTIYLQSLSCVVVAGTLAKWINIDFNKPSFSGLSLTGGIGLLIVILFSKAIPVEKLQGRYQVGYYQKTDLQQLHEWIKDNTPITQKFLVDPTNTGFTSQALRPSEFTNRAIVHYPGWLIPFYKDFTKIYGVTLDDIHVRHSTHIAYDHYHNLVGASPREYPLRIVKLKEFNSYDTDYEVIHEVGDWALIIF